MDLCTQVLERLLVSRYRLGPISPVAPGDKAEGSGGRGSQEGCPERRARGGIECVVSTGTQQ